MLQRSCAEPVGLKIMQAMEPVQADESKEPVRQNATFGVSSTAAGLVKAHRDIQRQISSLTRLQSLCTRRKSDAKLSIQSAFDQLHKELIYRQTKLMAEAEEAELSTVTPFTSPYSYTMANVPVLDSTGKVDQMAAQNGSNASSATNETPQTTVVVADNDDETSRRELAVLPTEDIKTAVDQEPVDVGEFSHITEGIVRLIHGKDVDILEKSPAEQENDSSSALESITQQQQQQQQSLKDIATGPAGCDTDTRPIPRPTGRGGIIRLPSMDVVSSTANIKQSYRDSSRHQYSQRSFVPLDRMRGGGGRGNCRRYSGPSTTAAAAAAAADHQRSNNVFHHNGCGSRSRSGSVVSMSRDESDGFQKQCDVSPDEITMRPRRSASVHADTVDEEGFTLVIHGRRGSGNRGFHRPRGSSGDSTSNAKYFYGHESLQFRQHHHQQQQQRGGGGERYWRGIP